MKRLSGDLRPLPVRTNLSCLPGVIEAAERELAAKARRDTDQCWGYFPALQGAEAIDVDLPDSAAFARAVPDQLIAGRLLGFNFLRLSLVQQGAGALYHLDSDAATALTGDTATLARRRVHRLLYNLSSQHVRILSYLDIHPAELPVESSRGYTTVPAEYATPDTIRTVELAPRIGTFVHGVEFCSNVVPHSGQDGPEGHFVAAFGVDEI